MNWFVPFKRIAETCQVNGLEVTLVSGRRTPKLWVTCVKRSR